VAVFGAVRELLMAGQYQGFCSLSGPVHLERGVVLSARCPRLRFWKPAAFHHVTCSVSVRFEPDGKVEEARVGEVLANVAERAKVDLLVTCSTGECGSCEIEQVDEESGERRIIRPCIAAVPSGQDRLLYVTYPADQIW
jgi:ferredoxin